MYAVPSARSREAGFGVQRGTNSVVSAEGRCPATLLVLPALSGSQYLSRANGYVGRCARPGRARPAASYSRRQSTSSPALQRATASA
ncbi:hypothetical protein, partial [Streptomyces sp. Wh19]|uniref:hypothetical protein n=1 Tax=Streptomyces sp. Wh19 TaxID=3076629 RepID=UPI0029583DC8